MAKNRNHIKLQRITSHNSAEKICRHSLEVTQTGPLKQHKVKQYTYGVLHQKRFEGHMETILNITDMFKRKNGALPWQTFAKHYAKDDLLTKQL